MINPRVLALAPHFLPGFKAGGPIRSLANLFESLGDQFDFRLVTGDRDLGDRDPYQFSESAQWQRQPGVQVKYVCAVDGRRFSAVRKAILECDYDLIYINSFFSDAFSVYPIWLMKLGLIKPAPLLIAPRGEFSNAALAQKSLKKTLYRKFSLGFGAYTSVFWQASSEFEAADVVKVTGMPANRIFIASDLPTRVTTESTEAKAHGCATDRFRIIFLARISPIKNLDFCLKTLAQTQSSIVFDIYGPIEDEEYFAACALLINSLPKNVEARYVGPIEYSNVSRKLRDYDLLFFPSQGENYGHVIAEALSVGTEVLTSDKTPWRNLNRRGLGRDYPLGQRSNFVSFIEERSKPTSEWRINLRKEVLASFEKEQSANVEMQANEKMFRDVLVSSRRRD